MYNEMQKRLAFGKAIKNGIKSREDFSLFFVYVFFEINSFPWGICCARYLLTQPLTLGDGNPDVNSNMPFSFCIMYFLGAVFFSLKWNSRTYR